eukprot:TRINITY_DN12144_c0_g1_i1.p1 TRINITY_DN12144_c0_g1~~TRINITY_DN12144_c0_g1_i1.p1  ORF type:complete len:930 (+),score=284.11 TRINITY_DN12144_c0_g1_i1:422-3211(+)
MCIRDRYMGKVSRAVQMSEPSEQGEERRDLAQQTSAKLLESQIQAHVKEDSAWKYRKAIERMKDDQLQRWDEVQRVLSSVEVGANEALRKMIAQLQHQSEINKRLLMEELNSKELNSKENLEISRVSNISLGSEKPKNASAIEESKKAEKKNPRGRLFIDVERVDKELTRRSERRPSWKSDHDVGWKSGEEDSVGLLEVSQMRLFLGSEQLLRQHSARTLSHSISSPSRAGDFMEPEPEIMNTEGDRGSSIFEGESFKDFTSKKLKEFTQKDNMRSLLRMREHALNVRHQAQAELMQQLLDSRRVSPRTFQRKAFELERWVTKEREDIRQARQEYEKSLFRFAEAVKRTQRDIEFMKKVKAKSNKRSSQDFRRLPEDISAKLSSPGDLPSGRKKDSAFAGEPESFVRSFGFEMHEPPSSIKVVEEYRMREDSGMVTGEKRPERRSEDYKPSELELTGKTPGQVLTLSLSPPSAAKDLSSFAMTNIKEFPHTVNEDLREELHTIDHDNPKFERPSEKLDHSEVLPEPAVQIEVKNPEVKREEEVLKEKKIEEEEAKSLVREVLESSFKKGISLSDDEEVQKPRRSVTDDLLRHARSDPESALEASGGSEEYKHHLVEAITDDVMELIVVDFICEFEQLLSIDRFAAEEEDFEEPAIGIHPDPQSIVQPDKQPVAVEAFATPPSINTGNESASPDKVSPFESGKSAVIVSARERPSPVRAKSIRTNLSAVHEYLQALISLIKSQFINLFITNINIPLGANPIERLKSYHVVDPAANDSFSLDSSQIQAPPVLGIELFLALEDELARRRGNNLPEEVLELEHIHNKLIFDALNEILDEFRPFGLKGKPAPWRNSSRKVFFKRITVETALDVLDKAKERVVEWASSMCGFIHDKDDNLLGRDLHLDEDYINHIKEDRLARMLANEVLTSQRFN